MTISEPRDYQIPQLRRLWTAAFGDGDDFLDLFFSTAYAPDRCRCVSEAGEIQSVLYWFDCALEGSKLAYIYAVATDPACRGRGLCRALMEDTLTLLRIQGYSGAVLLPQEEWLISMYAAMGFLPCTTVTEKWFPAGAAIPIRKIDYCEYAALRRDYLPAGGVIQECENLTFLATMADFYAGENFIAAAAMDGTELWCPEFLGNDTMVPGLIRTLGFSAGRARMPGSDRPFAMFCPLTKDCPTPGYFGLVFD